MQQFPATCNMLVINNSNSNSNNKNKTLILGGRNYIQW